MDIANLIIRVTNQGLADNTRGLDRLGRNSRDASRETDNLRQSVDRLKLAFAGMFAGVSVMSILKTADAMQSLNSKIKLATSSTEEYLAVQGRLRAMAQSNLTEYDSLVDLYASSRRALKQLGKTQNETLAFTDNLTKAMFVGGGAASSQAAALVQLGQALASGVLRGDEFNSIAEQAPILLELVAEKMGVAQGALRKLAADGKISSRVLYDAISGATEKLADMAGKMPATMTQALETVKNQYKFFIDDMLNSTGGFSSIVADALLGIGQNLNSLIPILVAGGLAWGAYALATSTAVTTSFAAAIGSMTTMGYWFASNTLLINAQITSYLGLTAVIDRYNLNMMLARLTLASYIDLVKTSVGAVQAKAVAMTNAARATLANIGADIRHGQVIASLVGATTAATAAIAQKVAAMRAGVTTASVYAASLRVVAGAAAVTATAIKGLGAAFASLGAIIKAHPIMIIGSVLLAFVAASKNAEGKVLGLSGAMSSLGDAVKVIGYVLVDIIGGIKDVASIFGKFIVSMITNSEKGAKESSAMFQMFFANTEGGFVGMLQVMARFADLAGATMKTLVEAIGRGFGNMLTDVSNRFASLGNSIIEIMNKVTTAITGVVNGGLDLISGMVSIANKIPFVNIADDKRRSVAKTIDTRFNDNKKLDTRGFSYELGKNYGSFSNDGMANRLQGHIDSMKGAKLERDANLDLASAITTTGDESDKAKKKKVKNAKKVKEAVDKEREAYQRLVESYNQQMAAYDKEGFMAEAPFTTELRDMAFELEHAFGKFSGLSSDLKKNLAEAAKSIDAIRVNLIGKGMIKDLQKELQDLDEENALQSLLNDFNDLDNILSTLDLSVMRDLQKLTVDIDIKKQSKVLTEILEDTQKQLVLLGAVNNLERQNLEIDYESADLLKKFTYLKEVGLEADYEALKVALDATNTSRKHLALLTKQKEANEAITDAIKDLNKEIALFDSTDAMAEFYYDLKNTDKYLHSSVEKVKELEQALLRLKGLKTSEALDDLMGELSPESPLEALRTQYQERMAVVEEFERAHNLMLGTLTEERLAIDKAYAEARTDLMLSHGETMFGALSSMAGDFAGKQSMAYRVLFAIEKGFAIASAALAIKTSIAKATAMGVTPFDKAFYIAEAVATGAGILSTLKSVQMAGFKQGGYTGNMGASQVAGVVHGQEYVFDAQSTKRIGVDNLNAMRRGDKVGGDVQVNIINNSSARVTASDDGQTITIEDVRNENKRSWTNLSNPNSFESKQVNRNVQAPRRR